MFAGKEFTRPPKATLDLIGHHHHAMLGAEFADAL